jgi:hypothetical protein
MSMNIQAGKEARPEPSVHSRMRQRIVAISRTRASNRRMARDRYLRNLVRGGAVTSDDVDSAIDACGKALSEFTWLLEVDDGVLGRADHVFLLRHGRFPRSDDDFRLNGDHYRICRSLQYDWHYYDRELGQSPQAPEAQGTTSRGQPASSQATRTKPSAEASMALRRGSTSAFVGVLTIGVITVPILAIVIVQWFPQDIVTASLWMGGAWLALLVGALALTLPRRR